MRTSGRHLWSFVCLTGCLLCAALPGSASEPVKKGTPAQQAANAGTPTPQTTNAADIGIPAMPEPLLRQLIKQEPKLDLTPPPTAAPRTQGKPVTLTVGIEEQNLAIEWDDWHNKVANAVLPHIFANVVDSINVPQGTSTMVHFVVASDRKITSVQVIKSSGNLQYDRLVRDAVYKIDGNYVLKFPAASKRTEVATNVAFGNGGGQKNYIEFGDVEYSEMDDTQQTAGAAAPSVQQNATNDSETAKKRHRIW